MASPLVHPIEGARLLRTHSTGEDVRGNEREGSRQVRECMKGTAAGYYFSRSAVGPPAVFTEAKPIFALGCRRLYQYHYNTCPSVNIMTFVMNMNTQNFLTFPDILLW